MENGYSQSRFSVVNPPFNVSGGYYLVAASWPNDFPGIEEVESGGSLESLRDLSYTSTLDLYDDDWQLLYAWTVSREAGHGDIGRLLHTDGNGNVYATLADGSGGVGRFRLEVTPPD